MSRSRGNVVKNVSKFNHITHRNSGNKGNDVAQKFNGIFINQLTLVTKVTKTVLNKVTMVMVAIKLIININRFSLIFAVGLTHLKKQQVADYF